MRRFPRLNLALLLMLLVFTTLLGRHSADAQSKSVVVNRRDATFDIKNDGTINVVETWEVQFKGGPFRSAFRNIPLKRVDSLSNWSVREGSTTFREDSGETPGTYDLKSENGGRTIKWFFEPATNDTRTFELSYTLNGALQLFPGGDQFYWTFIESDRGYTINSSRVEVHFPLDIPDGQLRSASYLNDQPSAQPAQPDARTLVYTGGPFAPSQTWELRAQVPHGLINAPEPNWQVAERWAPLLNTISLALAGLLFIGGMLGLLLIWYRRGRDVPTGLQAEFIAQPPADVPAGIAGVLLEEIVQPRHVIATLVDLAQRGFLRMNKSDDTIHLERLTENTSQLRPFEQRIVDFVFGSYPTADIKNRGGFVALLDIAKKSLYDAAIEAQLFNGDPKKVKGRYLALGFGLLGTFLVGGCCSYIFIADYAPASFLVVLAGAADAIGLMVISPWMAQRTRKGAQAAAHLRAFQRYLGNITRYTQVQQAKDQFERYLPYAIAFGLEKEWVNAFAAVDTPAPAWYGGSDNVSYGNTYYDNSSPSYASTPSPVWTSSDSSDSATESRPTSNGPTLDGAAAGAFSSLNSVSAGFFSMLNDASNAFNPASSSSSSSSSASGSSSSDSWWSSSSSSSDSSSSSSSSDSWSSSSSSDSWSSSSDSGGGGSSGFD